MEIIIHHDGGGEWVEVFVDGTRFYRSHSMSSYEWRELLRRASGHEINLIYLYSEISEDEVPEMDAFNEALSRGEHPPLPSFTTLEEGEYQADG